jgi:hypothetical protein
MLLSIIGILGLVGIVLGLLFGLGIIGKFKNFENT